MTRMTPANFEARYAQQDDPWGYTRRAYEQRKYAATLDACGSGPLEHALELGGSIGVFSDLLAPRCRRLTTVDAAPTAVGAARHRLDASPHVEVILGAIPDALPDGRFDLVVASEILYYLDADELRQTLERLHVAMDGGARLVAVHWRQPGPERPLDAASAHARLDAAPWLSRVAAHDTEDYLLGVWERA